MPIKILSAAEAHENSRKPAAKWPTTPELQANRLVPLAKPQFEANFEICKEDLVFTIGSCFARNIEKQLAAEGFDYASKDFHIPDDESDFNAASADILNKFVSFSVLNELRWALVPGESFSDDNYVEVRNGKFVDPHLHGAIVPAALDRVKNRRRIVTEYMKMASKAKVFIMTLGLGEAWFDTQTGYYLNGMPHRSSRDRDPARFEFHILDYNQIVQSLEDIHALLTEYGDPELRFLITVSPVALGTTFSGKDALIANTYSKAVQRTAVEAFVYNHDNVDYFPSYESVTLSDRGRAWREDQSHASDEIVRYNVLRMMGAYMPQDHADASGAVDQADKVAEAFGILKEAKKLSEAGAGEHALDLFKKASDIAPTEGLILLEYGKCLAKFNRWDEAVKVLRESTKFNSGPWSGFFHLAQAYRVVSEWQLGHDAVKQAYIYEPQRPGVMHLTGIICNNLGRFDEAMDVLEKLLIQNPTFDPGRRDYQFSAEKAHKEARAEAFLNSLNVAG